MVATFLRKLLMAKGNRLNFEQKDFIVTEKQLHSIEVAKFLCCQRRPIAREEADQFVTVWGDKVSEGYKASEIAKSKIDKIIIGDVENISIPYDNDYFDYIIYADVLEHLINPWELLTKHKSKLAYDGCIIASYLILFIIR